MEHKTEVSSEPEQTETPRLPIRVINLVGPDAYANPCAPPPRNTPPQPRHSQTMPNAEVEECKVDALSMNDAHLERLIGTDNYMAVAQALDMTVTSGQTEKVEEADEAKEAEYRKRQRQPCNRTTRSSDDKLKAFVQL